MKKYYSVFSFIAVTALTIVSCTKEIENKESVDNGTQMKTITVCTEVATKTTLDSDHENLVWSTGDHISLFNDQNNTNSDLTYSASGDITVSVPAATEEIYGHYPYYKNNTSGPSSVSIYISNSQTQVNPGELNGSNYPMVAKGTVDANNKAIMSFYPVASALALNIYNTNLSGAEKVRTVKVTPTLNSNFTGSHSTDITGDDIVYTTGNKSDAITVSLTNYMTVASSKPSDSQKFPGQIYVCLARQSYKAVKFEITTNKGVYTITSSATTAFDCENNDFVPVNLNLAKATLEPIPARPSENGKEDGYYRVDYYDWLDVGDEVIIASFSDDVALSTNQKTSNRGVIAFASSTVDNYKILTINDDIQRFTLEAGSLDASNSFSFKCKNGTQTDNYIYASSSSSNELKSKDTKDANASFRIDITSETGETFGTASIVAQGSNTRNTMQYNSGSSLFSCYASASQSALAIYKWFEDPTAVKLTLDKDSVSFDVTDDDNVTKEVNTTSKNISSWDVSIAGANEYTADDDFTVSDDLDAENNEGLITIAPKAPNNTYNEKQATVTIMAAGLSQDATISVSQAAKVASLSATPDKFAADAAGDIIEVTIVSNVPWNISTGVSGVVFTDSSDQPLSSSSETAPTTNTKKVYVQIPENTTGSSRPVALTVTPNEVGCGLSNTVVNITQSGGDLIDLDPPTSVTITAISKTSFTGTWEGTATDYHWILSTNSSSAIAESDNVASGNVSAKTVTQSVSLTPGETYYLHVKAVGNQITTDDSSYLTSSAKKLPVIFVFEGTDVSTTSGSSYSTTEATVTATDGSVWKITGYIKNSTDDYVQLGKGGANYLLTPSSTRNIKKITVNYYGNANYYLAVQNTSGTELLYVQNSSSATDKEFDFVTNNITASQVKLVGRRSSGTSNAAAYINSVTIEYQ